MTSSGKAGRPIWRSAALTECTRSRRESISVPSRSKITSLMECGSNARSVRIMDFQNKAHSTQPSALGELKQGRVFMWGQPPPAVRSSAARPGSMQARLQTEVYRHRGINLDGDPVTPVGFVAPFASGLERGVFEKFAAAFDNFQIPQRAVDVDHGMDFHGPGLPRCPCRCGIDRRYALDQFAGCDLAVAVREVARIRGVFQNVGSGCVLWT